MQGKPHEQLQKITDKDTTRSVDMLWTGIQKRYEQVKASNNGRLNSYKASIERPAPAGSFAVPTTNEEIIEEPGCETGLGSVQAKNDDVLEMPTTSGHSTCTADDQTLRGLHLRAQQIQEDMQRQRQEHLKRAAELFLAGPLAWPDYPDYEEVEFDDDEPLWEPLPPKP